MQDTGVLISHLASFLILFTSELINKAHWIVRAVKVRNSPLCSSVLLCSVQPALLA